MDYIEKILGVKTSYDEWDKIKSVPYFLSEKYEIRKIAIDTQNCLIIKSKTEDETVSTIKKHIQKLCAVEDVPVILEFEGITQRRRQSLIEERVSFLVRENQIYLPFMGVYLQEKFKTAAKDVEKLQPSAQLLLFYFIYQKVKPLYTKQVAENFGFSAMTITRAVKQLEQTGLITVAKDGVQKVIATELTGRKLFEKATPLLINPIRKKVYIENSSKTNDMVKAGITALSEITRINPPSLATYAIASQEASVLEFLTELVDAESQMELELWKYDPLTLGAFGHVDSLSLAVALANYKDERVEQMVGEMLEELWEDLDGKGV
ncbi:MAG: hypothetical protein JJE17_09490 [Peptostreptococcaceae bacterium]|nr:hypothetical protein [Peptostreptococcaceae bacterium]